MIERIPHDHGNVLGFAATGEVSKQDYDVLVPAVRDMVGTHGSARLLLDLTHFHWEKINAWGADWKFGHEFHDAIERMAIVGDHKWAEWLAFLVTPLYAREAGYYTDRDTAWKWLDD
jgi:hypothetical protein